MSDALAKAQAVMGLEGARTILKDAIQRALAAGVPQAEVQQVVRMSPRVLDEFMKAGS